MIKCMQLRKKKKKDDTDHKPYALPLQESKDI